MMDEEENININNTKSPIRRLGSTRKILHYNNIRLQLNEQLRCLDLRMETQTAVIGELQDYFRKRAEVELDYSKSLDKLAKSLHMRHKEQRQKREQWSLFSSLSCWQQLVTQTKNMSRDHAILSEIYSTHVINRFTQIIEDVQRIYKKCREIAYELHEEIMRVLHELHTTMKTYQSYQAEARQAETKLKVAEQQRFKIEQNIPKEKLDRSKKFRVIEKEVQKRKNKYFDAKLKALKARNEYTLCLESSNTTIHKYFVEDLSDLIDCMDFGFHHCVSRALFMYISSEEGRQKSESAGLDQLQGLVTGMDSRLDKQKFMEYNHSAFMVPKKFEFQGQKDEFAEPELQKLLCCEMETRLVQIKQRLTNLKTESEEIWKTLETAELSLLEMLTAKDYDCSEFFNNNNVPVTSSPETISIKLRADRHETEEFYLTKLREYLLGTSRIARLDTKHEQIRQTLVDHTISPTHTSNNSPSMDTSMTPELAKINLNGSPLNGTLLLPNSSKPHRRRIARSHLNSQPKLFGGSLEEYIEITNQEIPLIIKSCIRVINLYGLNHQGIFRVSGSQVEINNFKDSFEKGEDALAEMTDASDMNSIAGVFKLYLRELREPLFPLIYFEQFMSLSQLESKHEFVLRMKDLISTLPRSVVIVLRYIFAFLNHLSEYSDENMMDPYNLAICFGPTLVPVPDDKDQVQYQNSVNELIKNVILFSDDIFPPYSQLPGSVYEKYISRELEEDIGDSPSEIIHDQQEMLCPSEDECDSLEATAQFEFIARSERELTLKKGDHITLYNQVSNDWWRGSVAGQEGLIPDKYIMLKIKDEDKDKLETSTKLSTSTTSSSEESSTNLLPRRRVSSSNDSVLSATTNSSSIGNNMTWTTSSVGGHDNNQEICANRQSLESLNLSSMDDSGRDSICPDEYLILPDGRSTSSYDKITKNLKKELESKFNSEHFDNHVRGKSHWKSQSVDEKKISTASTFGVRDDSSTTLGKISFSENRELWQRRATSQTHLHTGTLSIGKDLWDVRYSKDTPDLVMDLPDLSQKSTRMGLCRDETMTEPESPDMSTTAERFAKHQCTLKKNTKNMKTSSEDHTSSETKHSRKSDKKLSDSRRSLSENRMTTSDKNSNKSEKILSTSASPVPLDKPQILTPKPQVMRKPINTQHSPLILRKFNADTSSPSSSTPESGDEKYKRK